MVIPVLIHEYTGMCVIVKVLGGNYEMLGSSVRHKGEVKGGPRPTGRALP